jgi:hypothetical protein
MMTMKVAISSPLNKEGQLKITQNSKNSLILHKSHVVLRETARNSNMRIDFYRV